MIRWARTGASQVAGRSTSIERPIPVDTNDQRPSPVTATANGIPVSVTNRGRMPASRGAGRRRRDAARRGQPGPRCGCAGRDR